jgi:hypothetical protein
MAQPKKFMTAVATRLGCCFRKCNLRKVKSFYELRLRTWSANYARQSELLCDAFTDYHTDATNTIAPVVDGVRLCKDCHIAVLGINKKRYNYIHRQWVQSGKNLKRRESLHGNRPRAALKKSEFEDYLATTKRVWHALLTDLFFSLVNDM